MKEAELYQPIANGKVKCTACARYCQLGEGQIGLCGIRGNIGGKLQLLAYGKLFTGHIDPIEKKPVTHYRPGTRIFSVSTSGCSWLCHPAGTKVLMADRTLKNIENVVEGDSVWSYNIEQNMKIEPNVVTHRGIRFAEIYEIRFGNNSENVLELTGEHPVLTGNSWKEAKDITSKDCVVKVWAETASAYKENQIAGHSEEINTQSSQKLMPPIMTNMRMWLPVKSANRTGRIEQVYAIETIPNHNYVADSVIVHNCSYCQNYEISQRRKIEGIDLSPEDVPRLAMYQGCQGVAYTYNEPTIFIEYARDIGLAAHKRGLFNIFVSNGFATPDNVRLMSQFLDCITVDFKGSGERSFVRKYIGIPSADPIFQTLLEVKEKTKTHIEITDLIVPRVGDDLEHARKLSRWVHDNLGPMTPVHFLRFHPDYKMMDLPVTPVETLVKHHEIAKQEGLQYAYLGNVPGHPLEHTYCHGCGKVVVQRSGFDITGWYLDDHNRCKYCGTQIPIDGKLASTVSEARFLPAYF